MSRPNQFLSPEGDLEDYFVDEYWLIDQWVGDTLMTWGQNTQGHLGINNLTSISTPVTTFAGGTNWKQVSGGYGYSAAIKTDGTLWAWGQNLTGTPAIGDNTAINKLTPVTTFAGGTNWKQVDSGTSMTAAIKTDGTLWTWGRNSNGGLGINDTINRSTPVTTFAGGTNWKQVSCGVSGSIVYAAAIKTDGTLWTWGRNGGRLGDNTTVDRSTPVTTFAGGTNWKQVDCGYSTTVAIKTDGTLWTWGSNANGRLGINNSVSIIIQTPVTTFAGGTNWKQVSCGYSHAASIKTDGTLWIWGRSNNGQLGTNSTIDMSIPVTTFAGGTNWKQVSCVGQSTVVIKTNGTLWTWGRNNFGQLGDNNIINRSTPVTTFAGGTNWKQVSCGYGFMAAVTSGTDPTFFIA